MSEAEAEQEDAAAASDDASDDASDGDDDASEEGDSEPEEEEEEEGRRRPRRKPRQCGTCNSSVSTIWRKDGKQLICDTCDERAKEARRDSAEHF